MKTIKVLLFIIFFIYEQSTYSINELINYLQESGYYDVIQQLKIYFGDDVAISFCLETVESDDCETVVKVYMHTKIPLYSTLPLSLDEIINNLKKTPSDRFIDKVKILIKEYSELKYIEYFIKMILSFYDFLIEKKKEEEILDLIKKMIQKFFIKKKIEFKTISIQ